MGLSLGGGYRPKPPSSHQHSQPEISKPLPTSICHLHFLFPSIPSAAGTRSPGDRRKRKVSHGAETSPRRSRRLMESPPASKSQTSEDEPDHGEDLGVPEFNLLAIPRSPSPNCRLPSPHCQDTGSCPSPTLMGPYSPPASKGRRSSIAATAPATPIRIPLPSVPSQNPDGLSEANRRLLLEHEEWLQGELQKLSGCVSGKYARDRDDTELDSDTSDEDSDTESVEATGVAKSAGPTEPFNINAKYLKDVYTRFEDCRRLSHLPTLNLVFTLLESIMLVGSKRSISVLLRKSNLPKLLTAMQYNPKLNHLVNSRLDHLNCLGRHVQPIPLSAAIVALINHVNELEYLKNTIIPVVCDEGRYLNLNIYLVKMKSKLCEAIFNDRRLLPSLFGDLKGGDLCDEKTVIHLRFLKV